MEQQVDPINPKTYRDAARFFENEVLDVLTISSEISFIPVLGNLQYSFPRPSPEARATQRGFSLLRVEVDEVVAILYALAAAKDANKDGKDQLVLDMFIKRVGPYVTYYSNHFQNQQSVNQEDKPARQKEKSIRNKRNKKNIQK